MRSLIEAAHGVPRSFVVLGRRPATVPTREAVARFARDQHLVWEFLAEEQDHETGLGQDACHRVHIAAPIQHQLAAVGCRPFVVEIDHRRKQPIRLADQAIEVPLVAPAGGIDRVVAVIAEQPQVEPFVEIDAELFHDQQVRLVCFVHSVEPLDHVASDFIIACPLRAPADAAGRKMRRVPVVASRIETREQAGLQRVLHGDEAIAAQLVGDPVDVHRANGIGGPEFQRSSIEEYANPETIQ